MDRNDILETMYSVIKESAEWGIDCNNGTYGHFVDGVVAMTEELLRKNKEKENAEAARLKALDMAMLNDECVEAIGHVADIDVLNKGIEYIGSCKKIY